MAEAEGSKGFVSPAKRRQQAKEALEKKYNEEFEITSFTEAGWLQNYFTVTAYASEYPDLVFQASIEVETGNLADGYVTKRVCERISDQVSRNLGKLETDYYVFTQAMISGTVLTDPNVSLKEYMQEGPGNKFTISVCLNTNEADLQNIASTLGGLLEGLPEIRGSVRIYLADAELMSLIQEYVTSHENTYDDFHKMTQKAYIGHIDFQNGELPVTEKALKEMAGELL